MLINAEHQVRDKTLTESKLKDKLTPSALSDLVALLDGSRPLENDWTLGGFKILGAGEATAADGLITKSQLDAAIAGFDYIQPVDYLSNVDVDIATGGLLTVDNVVVSEGDRVALIAQTDSTENGVYTASSGAWSRATDVDSDSEFSRGIAFFVVAGEEYANSGWWSATQSITVGTDAINFVEFNKPIYKFGSAFTTTGSLVTLNIDPDGGVYLSGNGAAIKLDGSSLSVTSAGLTINTGGVTNDMLAGGISLSKLSDGGELLKRDGSVALTGDLPMGGNKITGLANGVDDTDAATVGQVPSLVNEAPVGTKDGVNKDFTLSAEPTGVLLVFWNGQLRSDVSYVGTTLTTDGFNVEASDSLTVLFSH